MSHPFYIVDVFAESKYAGNQLAVVRHAADLDAEQMQSIAREMHYSETTFILSDEPRNSGYDVRIFTPGGEVPFAGHPTLGTAFVVVREIIGKRVETVTLNLGVGPIPVTFQGDELWMKQIAPTFGKICTVEELASVLTLEASDFDTRFPIQEVSTGLPFILVPLKNLAAVKRAQIQIDLLKRLVENLDAKMIFLFSPETYDPTNQLNARMFGDLYGVPEDPATGSGNGCLAGYLVHYRYWGKSEIEARVEQGYEIKRPSILRLRAAEQDGTIAVNVGGKVFLVAQGELV